MNTLTNNEKINILDLPNEMLFAIFNKLNTIDLFYSLTDINQQLNQLIYDTILHRLITDQITNLSIEITDEITPELSTIFALILSKCKHLNELTYKHWFTDKNLTISIFNLPLTSCVSSILTKLNIFVN